LEILKQKNINAVLFLLLSSKIIFLSLLYQFLTINYYFYEKHAGKYSKTVQEKIVYLSSDIFLLHFSKILKFDKLIQFRDA